MKKYIFILTLIVSFIVGISYVAAQTSTPTVTPTPGVETDPTPTNVPAGAPATGMGVI